MNRTSYLGVTAQSYSRVHTDNRLYDSCVVYGHPNGVTTIKVSFVWWLKSYVIWIQTGVIQVGFYYTFFPVGKDKRNKANFKQAP